MRIPFLSKLRTLYWLLTRHHGLGTRIRLCFRFRAEKARWLATTCWDDRVRNALAAPDNARIPRVPGAGRIHEGTLTLHNGIRVGDLSYDGEGPRRLMAENRGVHEPQEEYVFQEVLKLLPAGSQMLELGSYWAFYSLWFHAAVKDARCLCVEPDPGNLEMGRGNFVLNHGNIPAGVVFERAYAGAADGVGADGTPVACVDSLMKRHGIPRLAILHADTQGHEMNVLRGAEKALRAGTIDYVFLSTHSNLLHRQCLALLKKHGFRILADADLLETYSFDGLIVARRAGLEGPATFPIARRGDGRH